MYKLYCWFCSAAYNILSILGLLSKKHSFNTTANLSGLPQNMRNMLSYINTGTTNDEATEVIEREVKEARLKEEWKTEYMVVDVLVNLRLLLSL